MGAANVGQSRPVRAVRARPTGSPVLTPPGGLPILREGAADVHVPCRCGHGPAAHKHWRRGSDCCVCAPGGCATYRPRSTVRHVLQRLGLGS
jgi:hypothetical protein